VNSSTPSIGSVAVIDRTNSPNASQAQKKYGHVGVVVGINKDGSVLVKQSNKAGEEKVFTLTYRADQVYGYFDPTISKEQATASMGGEISTSYDNSIVDFLQKDHSKFNSTQWKAIEKAGYSVSEYLAQKQAYQNSVAKEITDTEIALLKDLYEMKKA
jgi:CHAP domain